MSRQKRDATTAYFSAFATNIRVLLEEQKETQEGFANAIGKSRPVVSQYCRGASQPDFETLVKIAKHFNVSIDWLLGVPNVPKRVNPNKENAMKALGLTDFSVQTIRSFQRFDKDSINWVLENLQCALREIVEAKQYAADNSLTFDIHTFSGTEYARFALSNGFHKVIYRMLRIVDAGYSYDSLLDSEDSDNWEDSGNWEVWEYGSANPTQE